MSRLTSNEDDRILLADPDDAWQESEHEQPRMFSGSARNYYYMGEGRIIPDRLLSTFAAMDQEQLSELELQPMKSKEQSQQHDYPDLPQGFSPSTGQHGFGGLFQPLPAETIRLLDIAPGCEGPISYRFFISSVSECAFKYEAISGSFASSQSERLYCNGIGINCNAEIVSLLYRLRLPDRSRLLWLPSLCINLEDLNERNYHVQRRQSIFQHTHKVIIWLGHGTGTEPDAQVASLCKDINSRRSSQLHETSPLTIPEAWSHAVRFFGRGWFARMWSLQEASVARSIVVLLGDNQISWDCIGLAAAILRENFGRIQPSETSVQNEGRRPITTTGILNAYLIYRISLCQKYFDPVKLTFHQLLILTRGFWCKFEQDKVYALLGVQTKDTASSNIVPDYTRSASQVNQDVAIAVLHTSDSLDILSQVQLEHSCRDTMPATAARRELMLDGPSWIPRWQTNITERICPLQTSAGFSAAAAASPTVQISPNHLKLAVGGVIVDTISDSRELRVFNTFWRGQDNNISNVWGGSELESFAGVLDAVALTKKELESLALTLTCGKRWDGFPVSDLEGHVADYARCLIRDGLRWSLNWLREIKGEMNLPRDGRATPINLEVLMQLSLKGRADRFLDAARTAGAGRARFTTQAGFWGIGPGPTTEGDLLCVIHGAGVPFVIRPLASGEYHLVGECYVSDIMHGEILDKGTKTPRGETWVTLV
ncbi:hypothetical protein FALBO_16734 [Fusarium albosuccineum]|uniref:Heterokaryon incompatibility domain-containing protein n=1 Tax=Fusarium albosuccineum TaxID=1237068 RepID=A0A8H4KCX7_9HYPO|nr:hypothetical protein FALBO_16734 [Fusarium albosuccineum]